MVAGVVGTIAEPVESERGCEGVSAMGVDGVATGVEPSSTEEIVLLNNDGRDPLTRASPLAD